MSEADEVIGSQAVILILQVELARTKELCARAADALEKIHKEWPIEELGLDASIIAELRKAAQ